MLVTDGVLLMAGREQELITRMVAVALQLRSVHCLIHHFISCIPSLQHRLFCQLLTDISAEYKDLLIENDIRWLSKRNTLKRFCELRRSLCFTDIQS